MSETPTTGDEWRAVGLNPDRPMDGADIPSTRDLVATVVDADPAPDPAAAFHAHLDRCARCEAQPFDLCADGAALLRATGTGATHVTQLPRREPSGPGVGAINRYACKACGAATVTVDAAVGTTPMVLRCQKCGGDQVSAFYRCDQTLIPVAEWRRPSGAELARLPRPIRRHVADGGLVLHALATGAPALHGRRPTAIEKTQDAIRAGGDARGPWDAARVDQARGFIRRAKKSDASRRREKASRKANRRRR